MPLCEGRRNRNGHTPHPPIMRSAVQNVRRDTVRNPHRGFPHRILPQVRIPCGGFHLRVTEQLSDRRKRFPDRQRPGREAVAGVMSASRRAPGPSAPSGCLTPITQIPASLHRCCGCFGGLNPIRPSGRFLYLLQESPLVLIESANAGQLMTRCAPAVATRKLYRHKLPFARVLCHYVVRFAGIAEKRTPFDRALALMVSSAPKSPVMENSLT